MPGSSDILTVNEIWNGRGGSESDKGERDYVRVFRVETINAYVGSISVRYAPGVPRRFDPYEDEAGNADLTALAKEVREQQDDETPWFWTVTITYSTKITQPELGDFDPLLRPAELKGGCVKFTRICAVDTDGVAILNSAGDFYDPPVEVEDERIEFSYSRFELNEPIAVCKAYSGNINSTAFKGFAIGQVKCTVAFDRAFEKGSLYWKFTYTFAVNFDGWDARVADRGFRKKSGADRVNITDKYGKPIAAPAFLDGSGGELADPSPSNAVYRTHKRYYRADFNDLNLV